MRLPRSRRRARGAPLWVVLLVLVALPLSSTVAFGVVLAHRAQEQVSASTQAGSQVRAAGLLAQAAGAVDQELLAFVVAAAAEDPGSAALLGPDGAADVVAALRAATDDRLATAALDPVAGATARGAQEQVARVRAAAEGVGPAGFAELRTAWTGVADELVAGQRAAVVAAAGGAAGGGTVAAIRDVRLLAELTTGISPDAVDYLTWQLLPTGEDPVAQRWQWVQSHVAAQLVRGALTTLSDTDLRSQAAALTTTPAATSLAAVLDAAQTTDPAVPTPAALRAFLEAATAVSAEASVVLDRAVTTASAAAVADGDRSGAEARVTVLAVLAAVLLAVVGALLLGRRVTRSLQRLAGQADDISQGRLVDVTAGGPREVRTVGSALHAAVASLRRIQAQAGAVARGDLDAPVLDDPLPGQLGSVVHASVQQLVSSVRQRDRLRVALTHQATHDPLTELPNRARAHDLTTAALHRARETGGATGLLFVDLDGFKAVNDRAGHAAGDAVLRAVARRMRGEARSTDVLSRLGGDEFVVLVEDAADLAELVALGERLVAAVAAPIMVTTSHGPRQVSVGASIGVALTGGADGVGAEELLARADAAVYRAKAAGRGRVEVFDDALRAQAADRRSVEVALRSGLAEGEVRLQYQPLHRLGDGSVLGYEALVRWDRPGTGLLLPDAFVPVAQQSELGWELDRWVLSEATRQLAEWRETAGMGLRDDGPTVSVNVSARFLADPRLADVVLAALVDSGLPARALVVDVGERVLADAPGLLGALRELRGLGVSVALDDFGTGPTSMARLRHLPVDTVKIDGSLLTDDAHDHRLVALMVQTAHASGLSVVVEGVESDEVLGRVAAESCDAAQGFHLAAPLWPDAAGEVFPSGDASPVPAG